MTMITLPERKEYRAALKQLSDLRELVDKAISQGIPLSDNVALAMEKMTGTTDVHGQFRAIDDFYSRLDRQYDDALRYAAQFRLSPFCEYMFRNEPPAMHHEFLIDHMEAVHNKEIMRLAVSMPPGSAKSTYSSIRFAAWHLGRRVNDRWLQGAHTQTFAKDRLGKPVRNLIASARYREVFPERVLSASSSAADYFEFANSPVAYYKAIGVGQGISGFRADIGAIDDPIASREDAESPTIRRKLHEWFEDDFGTRPMPGSPIFVVATRWHEDDLIGHELEKMKAGNAAYDWEVINIPALAEDDDPLGREPGEGLWPEVFGTEWYTLKKIDSTARSWNSLYQGKPSDEEGGVLKRSDISRWKAPPRDLKRKDGSLYKKIIKRKTLSVDCAEKATQRSDWTAATIWYETFDGKHYLVHAARCRREFTDMSKWIDELARGFNVDQILVEDKGAGTQYIQVDKERGSGPAPVIPISTNNNSKQFRFDGVTPMFTSGRALFPEKGTDWIADLEDELMKFPNAKNDDYVDSVSQYLSYSRKANVKRGTRKANSGMHGV